MFLIEMLERVRPKPNLREYFQRWYPSGTYVAQPGGGGGLAEINAERSLPVKSSDIHGKVSLS